MIFKDINVLSDLREASLTREATNWDLLIAMEAALSPLAIPAELAKSSST